MHGGASVCAELRLPVGNEATEAKPYFLIRSNRSCASGTSPFVRTLNDARFGLLGSRTAMIRCGPGQASTGKDSRPDATFRAPPGSVYGFARFVVRRCGEVSGVNHAKASGESSPDVRR